MIAASLKRRFLVAAAAALSCALLLTGLGLTRVFDHAMRNWAAEELGNHMRVLIANVRLTGDGAMVLDETPADPRFELRFGGLYWQIGRKGRPELKSVSLWGQALPWRDEQPPAAAIRWDEIAGPERWSVLLIERTAFIDSPRGEQAVRFAVGLDEEELAKARMSFLEFLLPSLATVGVVLIVTFGLFMTFAFRPLSALRVALGEVHAGRAQMVEGRFPSELQPLVDDLNRLLRLHDEDLKRARARTGDLAHGLKTPLAILSAVARDVERTGQQDVASNIQEQIARLDGIVRRELARARAGVRAGQSRPLLALKPSVDRIVRAFGKLGHGRPIRFRADVPQDLGTMLDETDFSEVLGNLLDNAGKWARSEARVGAAAAGTGVIRLTVEDDGPGMADDALPLPPERGRRLDESMPGAGFGLAIVRDLAEAYGGGLAVSRSPLGGLAVSVDLPGRPVPERERHSAAGLADGSGL